MTQILLILNNNRKISYSLIDVYYYYYRNILNTYFVDKKGGRTIEVIKDGKKIKEDSMSKVVSFICDELKLTKSYTSARINISEVCRRFRNIYLGYHFNYKMNLKPLLFKDTGICELCYPDVSADKFIRILKNINKGIAELVVRKSYKYKLPFFLGDFFMAKYKPATIIDGKFTTKYLPIDRVKTKKLRENNPGIKKNVYMTNEKSDGYIYVWRWYKHKWGFKNHNSFILRKSDALKKIIHNIVTEESFKDDYYTALTRKFA